MPESEKKLAAPKTADEAITREAIDAAKAKKLRKQAGAPIGAVPEEITEAVEGPQSLLTDREPRKSKYLGSMKMIHRGK